MKRVKLAILTIALSWSFAVNAQQKTYKVGDLYNEGGVKGIVVKVSNGGQDGVIMSLDSRSLRWFSKQSSQEKIDDITFGTKAFDEKDGEKNKETIKRYIDSRPDVKASDFPVYYIGSWYIPAVDELFEAFIALNNGKIEFDFSVFLKLDEKIKSAGGTSLFSNSGHKFPFLKPLFSSTEFPLAVNAYVVRASPQTMAHVHSDEPYKTGKGLFLTAIPNVKHEERDLRPFRKFSSSGATPVRQSAVVQVVPLSQAKQGDIVEINGVKAIVFQAYGDGHGMAMALDAFCGVSKPWGKASSVQTTDETNGKANTEQVFRFMKDKKLKAGDAPAFEWCQSLGDGWYIPAVSELETFLNFWTGSLTELDWEGNNSTALPVADNEGVIVGQNAHTKKINQRIAEAGGTPFSTFVYSSTEKAGKVLVFKQALHRKKDTIGGTNMTFDMEGIAKNKLNNVHIARAFIEY